jgi:hypothetical protein
MKRQKLCEYLGIKCTHDLNFLSLPPAIRLRIYAEADLGLLTNGNIFLGCMSDRHLNSTTVDNTIPSLLLSCRAIYRDISRILYSKTRF